MSRSKKKPWVSNCGVRAGDMKGWKNQESRKLRRRPVGEEVPDYATYKREGQRYWTMPSDGMHYESDPKWERK